MACAVDKIMTHLFHVFLALLCTGGIYLGLWFNKHFLLKNACPTIKANTTAYYCL